LWNYSKFLIEKAREEETRREREGTQFAEILNETIAGTTAISFLFNLITLNLVGHLF